MSDQTERNPVEVLAEEFLDRRRGGEAVRVEEYVTAHPTLESEIRSLFPAMIAFEDFKVCRISSSGRALDVQLDTVHQLGDFRIIREIGRGGMGVVYEAEQESLGRRVAVKVIPPGSISGTSQLDRFHDEARMAASLHHTNIVPVIGVGEQDGLHYYVMQRIRGFALDQAFFGSPRVDDETHQCLDNVTPLQSAGTHDNDRGANSEQSHELAGEQDTCEAQDPWTHLSRQAGSSAEWRFIADIGIQVANALAHAHEHGVLHQDIKPGNLLLDADGTVWVTDFGLATLLNSEMQQSSECVAGTLRFMAPEKLSGRQDARSDVYSLGVTLYELITRQPAFQKASRAKVIHRIIHGKTIPPRRIRPEIPCDLEAIVVRAMACAPADRYENAAALAADLRKFLDGRPVAARPVNVGIRCWRWVRRNPVVGSLLAMLLLGATLSFVLISNEWRTAVAEGRRAEGNLSLALESMDQILGRFTAGWMAHPAATADHDPEATGRIELTMAVSNYNADVLEDALVFYDRFAVQNSTSPRLKTETANVHRRVGDIYSRLGRYAKAEKAYLTCLEMFGPDEAADSDELMLQRANVLNQIGQMRHATGQFHHAETAYNQAIDLLSKLPSGQLESQALQAGILNNLGQSLWLQGRHTEARAKHQRAIRRLEELVKIDKGNADYQLALARAYRVFQPFAASHGQRNRLHSTGVNILEGLVGEFPGVPDYQCELSEMLTSTSYIAWGRSKKSREEDLNRAVAVARDLCEQHSSIPRYSAVLAQALKQKAELHRHTNPDLAETLMSESIDRYRTLVNQFSDVPVYHLILATALRDYAKVVRSNNDAVNAEALLEDAVAEQKQYVSLRPGSPFGRSRLRHIQKDLARVQKSRHDTDREVELPVKKEQRISSTDKVAGDSE